MAKSSETELTPAQLELMNLFWEHGELGVAQVWKLLGKRCAVARNTVQTMLSRLAERGWLRARAEANAFFYRAVRTRDSSLRRIVGNLVDTAFDGSAAGLVMTLLESRRISPEEADRIRALIDDSSRGKP